MLGPVEMWGTRRVVHISTGSASGRFEFVGAMRDHTQRDAGVADGPAAFDFAQADPFAAQSLVEVDQVAAPFDLAIGAHAANLLVG